MEKYQSVTISSRTGLWGMVQLYTIGSLVFGAFEHNTLGDDTDLIVCMLLSSGQWLEINTLFDTIENVLAETIENILYEHSLGIESEPSYCDVCPKIMTDINACEFCHDKSTRV